VLLGELRVLGVNLLLSGPKDIGDLLLDLSTLRGFSSGGTSVGTVSASTVGVGSGKSRPGGTVSTVVRASQAGPSSVVVGTGQTAAGSVVGSSKTSTSRVGVGRT
jgi:hypothetical protein